MRHVILQIDISLDGFVSGPRGELDWINADEAMNRDANALLTTADTVLLGRTAYEMFASVWPFADANPGTTVGQIAQRLNQADKVVFSRTLTSVSWGKLNNVRLATHDVADEVKEIKAQPGAHMMLYAGANIVSTFIALDLIDRYRLRIHPVLLGTGQTIFSRIASIARKSSLALVATTSYANGVVMLDYVRQTTR